MRVQHLCSAIVVLFLSSACTGIQTANADDKQGSRKDTPELLDDMDSTLRAVSEETELLLRDVQELEALLTDHAAEQDSEDGAQLFATLKAANSRLEAAGIKAFGDLDGADYQSEGVWNVQSLREDLAACEEELALQEQEQKAEASEQPKLSLRNDNVEEPPAKSPEEPPAMQLKENVVEPKVGLRTESDGEPAAACPVKDNAEVVEEKAEEPAQAAAPPEMKLRDTGGEAPAADGGEEKEEDGECAVCEELDGKIAEAEAEEEAVLEAEGRALFEQLKDINPYVEERVYRRQGKWRKDILQFDIDACAVDEEEDEDEEGAGTGEECEGGVCGLRPPEGVECDDGVCLVPGGGGGAGGGGEESGEELFGELVALNAELEAAGVKAFGDLRKEDYQRPDGEWAMTALREDLALCREEAQLQAGQQREGEEEGGGGGGGEDRDARVGKYADIFTAKLREEQDTYAKAGE